MPFSKMRGGSRPARRRLCARWSKRASGEWWPSERDPARSAFGTRVLAGMACNQMLPTPPGTAFAILPTKGVAGDRRRYQPACICPSQGFLMARAGAGQDCRARRRPRRLGDPMAMRPRVSFHRDPSAYLQSAQPARRGSTAGGSLDAVSDAGTPGRRRRLLGGSARATTSRTDRRPTCARRSGSCPVQATRGTRAVDGGPRLQQIPRLERAEPAREITPIGA